MSNTEANKHRKKPDQTQKSEHRQGLHAPRTLQLYKGALSKGPKAKPSDKSTCSSTEIADELADSLYDDSPVKPSHESSLLNVDTSHAVLENTGMADPLQNCLCLQSDRASYYVICTKCRQNWHQRCANLEGLNETAIKKLKSWLCPNCFTSPFVIVDRVSRIISSMPGLREVSNLSDTLSKLSAVGDSLKDNISTIETFDLHLKHVLLNESLLKEDNDRIRSIQCSIDELSRSIDLLTVDKISEPSQPMHLPPEQSLVTNELLKSIDQQLKTLTAQSDRVSTLSLTTTEPIHDTMIKVPHIGETACPSHSDLQFDALSTNMCTDLETFLTQSCGEFSDIGGSRDVLYYGEYAYKYSNVTHPALETPSIIENIIQCITNDHPNVEINSCLVTR